MSSRETLLVARKELRETLRDRRTVALMVLFPLVVYPLLSLVMAEVVAARTNRAAEQTLRVAVNGPDPLAEAIRARLTRAATPEGQAGLRLVPPAPPADLATNRVDAIVVISAPQARGGATASPPVEILFDQTREASTEARDRAQQALANGGGAGCAPLYSVTARGVAAQARVGGYVLSKVLPLVLVVMLMLGAFHPAIDITAGERERGTLETTLSIPLERSSLMAGKVLAVATLAALTGILNLASMSLTVFEGARIAAGRELFTIPWLRAAAALAVVPPAALLFGSVMVAVGAMARSYKEAQTLLTPVYFLCMAPSLAAGLGDFPLAGGALFVPGVNVTLLARDLIAGQATAGRALIVVATTLAYSGAAMALAARLYDSERLLGADEPGLSLSAWLRRLVRADRGGNRTSRRDAAAVEAAVSTEPTAGHAVALYAVACVLLFFVFVPLQAWRLEAGLALSEWGGLLGLTALYARGVRRPLAEVLRVRHLSLRGATGAILVGLSAWLVVGLLTDWIAPAPKEVVDNLRRAIAPPQGRGLVATLALMALSPAVCEEALFRGPILRGLRTRFSPTGAAVLTGLLFGLFHGDIWRLLPTAVLGMLLSAVALATDNIVPAMIVHFINNASLVLLARLHADEPTGMSVSARLALIGLGGAVLGTGLILLARERQPRAAGGGVL